jgi:hypothetical protein
MITSNEMKHMLMSKQLTFDMLATEDTKISKLIATKRFAQALIRELEEIHNTVTPEMQEIVRYDIRNVKRNIIVIHQSCELVSCGYAFCLN